MALKLHHCAVDGLAGVHMMAALHDLAADSPRPAESVTPWVPGTLPSAVDLLSRTFVDTALYPFRTSSVLASNAPKVVRGIAGLPRKLVGGVTGAASESIALSFAPKTRFNQTVSPDRVFEARFHALTDFKRIKASVPGSTINDVALAYVGGALRGYLDGHGELPDESLVAMCPISVRHAGDKPGQGNRLSARLQMLGTDVADPLERLAAIAAATASSRSRSEQSARTDLLDLIGIVPTSLLGIAAKVAGALPFSGPTLVNTGVTNIPGPTEPIFFKGARLVRATGLGPLVAGYSLSHVVASLAGGSGALRGRDGTTASSTRCSRRERICERNCAQRRRLLRHSVTCETTS